MKYDPSGRRPRQRFVLATAYTLTTLVSLAMLTTSSLADGPDDISDRYQWKPVKFGGNGFAYGQPIGPKPSHK
jgi:hypothetical protein